MMLLLTIWPVIAALLLATRVLGAVEANSVYNGPYQMYRCGQQDQRMQGLLAQTTSMLEAAIKDVSTGISSDFGYSAIFKHPTDVPYIKAVLQKMADGSPMPVQTNHPPASRSPILICVRPGDRDPTMAQFTSKCTGQGPPAVLIPDTPWVVLCPSFFTMKETPEKIDCPMTNSRGMLSPKYALIANQISALARQLAHFYLGRDDLRPEACRETAIRGQVGHTIGQVQVDVAGSRIHKGWTETREEVVANNLCVDQAGVRQY